MGQTPFAKMTRNRKQRFETLPAILFFNFIEKQRTRRSQTIRNVTKKKAEQHQERIKIHQSQSGQTTHLFLDLCRGVRQKQHNQGNHRAWKGILQEPQGGIHKRTIVVTALTGAAAVTIGGETTHGACHLNRTKNIDEEQQEQWSRACLLIINEV
jgi:hypothetical protein